MSSGPNLCPLILEDEAKADAKRAARAGCAKSERFGCPRTPARPKHDLRAGRNLRPVAIDVPHPGTGAPRVRAARHAEPVAGFGLVLFEHVFEWLIPYPTKRNIYHRHRDRRLFVMRTHMIHAHACSTIHAHALATCR